MGIAKPSESTISKPDSHPLAEIQYRKKLLLVVALSISLTFVAKSQYVVATSAQNIVSDIGGFNIFTWMFIGFSLSGAMAIPIIGKISDVYGTRQILFTGLIIFLLSSLAGALAQSMTQMIIARTVQGVGFAAVLSGVYIATALMWEPKARARWMVAVTGSHTLSGILGPVIGGVISDQIGWRWGFWIDVPLTLIAIISLILWFPKIKNPARTYQFDFTGAMLFCIFSASALFAISMGSIYGWTSQPIIVGGILACLGLVGFIVIELRSIDPMIPMNLFKSRVFSAAVSANMTITISFVVSTIFIPLLIIGSRGQSATVSSIPLISQAFGIVLGANLSGQILSRKGFARELAAVGSFISAVVLFWIGYQAVSITMVNLSFGTFLIGIGASMMFTAFTVPIQNHMPAQFLGVVTTTMQFARSFGMAIGGALLGAILLIQIYSDLESKEGLELKIRDPEIIVNEKRLANLKSQFISDPELGSEIYEKQLSESRTNLGHGIGVIFKVSGFISGAGILFSIIAFSGISARPDNKRKTSF